MLDLRLWEMFGYPALAAGFVALHAGARRGAQVWALATAALIGVVWAASAPDSANRARLETLGSELAWALALGVPVLGYALLIGWARRKGRERDE